MKCPICGTTHTYVRDVDEMSRGLVKKRYHECGNNHKFNTYQVPETLIRAFGMKIFKKLSKILESGIEKRILATRRRRVCAKLTAEGKSASDIASMLGVTAARIRQIQQESQ